MILHTINAAAGATAFRDCLRVGKPGDALLLMGDGVYAALAGGEAASMLVDSGIEVHILEPDARSAGILTQLPAYYSLVDYDGFVELTERFTRQMAWY